MKFNRAKVDDDYKADILVYVVNDDYKATSDEKWYYVNDDYKATTKIYWVNEDYRADLKVFFVNDDYKAKWNTGHSLQNRL